MDVLTHRRRPERRRNGPRRTLLAVLVVMLAVTMALGVTGWVTGWLPDGWRLPESPAGQQPGDGPAAVRQRAPVTGATTPLQEIQVGTCFQDLPEGSGPYSGVEVVPCDGLHENQLVAVFDLADREWPGADAVAEEAESRCNEIGSNVVRATGTNSTDWQFWVLVPTRQGWLLSDRAVQCVTYDPLGATTGSLFG